nr:hypothetical protein CFP56_07146 [Quercus suber]
MLSGTLLPAPRGMLVCPRQRAMALASCLGLDCLPMRAVMALPLAACMQACLGLGCCMPWPWRHTHGGFGLSYMPWPWLLLAHMFGVIS